LQKALDQSKDFAVLTEPVTTARAIYGENTCNFGANQTVTKNAFGAALHTTSFDRVNGDI
jgi:hypothetical protein